MFGLVGCPAFQTARKYFITGSLISQDLGIYCTSIKRPRGKEKEKQRERMVGRKEGQQMAEMILNEQHKKEKKKKNFRQTVKEGKLEELLFCPLLGLTCMLRIN